MKTKSEIRPDRKQRNKVVTLSGVEEDNWHKLGFDSAQPDIKIFNEINKALVRRAVEQIWNGGNYDTIEEFVAQDFVAYAAAPADEIRGPENAKQYFIQLHKAFPDIRFTIMDQVAEGDKVATHWTATGTHRGEFRGLRPTGKRFTITAIDIDRIVNGKVVECWSHMDELRLLQQLGAIPTSG